MGHVDSMTPFGAHFQLPRSLVDRTQYITSKCVGKRCLHVGCVDYARSGTWERMVTTGQWLHGQIEKVAGELVGVDIAGEAVSMLRERYGIKNICVLDAQHLETLQKGLFDVIIAGEILEHLPCPGSLLNSAHTVLKENGSLIVTTTNAFCLRRFMRIPLGKESVHPDHLAYFSHGTLRRLAEVCGYRIIEQCAYRLPNRKPWLPYITEKAVSYISPNLCEGIISLLKSD